MNIIIPVGGLGLRFKDAGYTTPKPLVKALGKEIIRWVIDSLPTDSNIFIAYNKELESYNFSNFLREHYTNVKSFPLVKNTCGSAETVKLCIEHYIKEDEPFVLVDCDSFVTDRNVFQCYGKNAVVCFESTNENYSYYKLDSDGFIEETAEKVPISNLASCGIYSFKSTSDYLNSYDCSHMKGEYYISKVVNQMIGKQFQVHQISEKDFNCLGTPIQLRCFCNNIPCVPCVETSDHHLIETMRICFDLDNTLVTPPVVPRDYSTCEPILKNVEFCRYLKKLGHTIIIHTARRMKTHRGNVGSVARDIGKVTFETLEKLEIPFDELYFGKPFADLYIDDKAIDPNHLDIKTGFYDKKIEPRSFNQVVFGSDTVTKTSDNLSSEIYYYLNIPDSVKDLFPILVNYECDNKYTIEKINGVTVSELFTSQGTLPVNIFKAIFGSIERLHAIQCLEPDFKIEDVYSKKLEQRGLVPIDQSLLEYEKTVTRYTCIHGDPVFTNILVNNYGKIKLIDPRGSIGPVNTIYGDPMYDWAKIYQSIIGYDFILMNKPIIIDRNILDIFESHFSSDELRNIKIICKSLVQSLMPLHEKHHLEFSDLIKTITY